MVRAFHIPYAALKDPVRLRFTRLQAVISSCMALVLLLWAASIGVYVTYGTRNYEITMAGGIIVLLDTPPLPTVVAPSGLIVRTEFSGCGFIVPYIQESAPGFRAYVFPLYLVIIPLGCALFVLKARRRRLHPPSGGGVALSKTL